MPCLNCLLWTFLISNINHQKKQDTQLLSFKQLSPINDWFVVIFFHPIQHSVGGKRLAHPATTSKLQQSGRGKGPGHANKAESSSLLGSFIEFKLFLKLSWTAFGKSGFTMFLSEQTVILEWCKLGICRTYSTAPHFYELKFSVINLS